MAHVRSNHEVVSQLPTYEAVRSQDFDGWLIVTCPREDCGNKFLVKLSEWFAKRMYGPKNVVIIGRPCPYCFKASRLPSRRGIRYNH